MNNTLAILAILFTAAMSYADNKMPAELSTFLQNHHSGWEYPKPDPEEEKARLKTLAMLDKNIKEGKRKKSDYPGYDELASPPLWREGDFNGDGHTDYLIAIVDKKALKLLAVLGGANSQEFVLSTQNTDHHFEPKVFKKDTNFANYRFALDSIFINTYGEEDLERSQMCQWDDAKFACDDMSG